MKQLHTCLNIIKKETMTIYEILKLPEIDVEKLKELLSTTIKAFKK